MLLISLPLPPPISFGFGTLIYSVNIRARWVYHSPTAYSPAKTSVSKALLPPPWVTVIAISVKHLFIKIRQA